MAPPRTSEATSERSLDAAALNAVDEAARAIAGLLDLDEALQLIVERVRSLVGARYAALGIVGPDDRIERFITSGMTAHQREAIGPLPQGRGLLGLIIRQAQSYRIPNIAAHPDSSGFPTNHPPMTSLLGVPVTSRGRSVGNFYLTDKVGASQFTSEDQRLVELFALHAGIAIDNARLHEQAADFAIVQERDRIGRDLHDGIIQSLYAVSLSLEDVPEMMTSAPAEAEGRIDAAIDSLQASIRELRNFIYGLRPETFDGAYVPAGILALLEQFRYNTLIDVEVEVDREAAKGLSAEHGAELLQVVRESLSNAARHARARHLAVTFRQEALGPTLVVADDGVGFDVAGPVPAGHQGLANMNARAEAIGGRLRVESAKGEGTRIILVLPGRADA
ncbi:MAG TPA: GAF domain-containing sensor histidine kinase [Candidatus Limnocylindrales bacterium]|jgi:signal transduction histidine kinase